MYAIVEIAGQQFKVAKDQKLFVHRLADKEGAKVRFENVLLLDDGKKVTVGAPAITGASVEAKVTQHLKGDKVIVFKKKRRKGYRVKNGHRQYLTELVIEKINEKGAAKAAPKAKAAEEKPAAKKAAPKKTATKAAAKTTAKAAPAKAAPAKKSPAKKVAPKKATAKTTAKAPAKKTTAAKKPAAKKTTKK